MARKLLLAGNWKMNKTAAEAAAMITEFKGKMEGVDQVELLLCPTFTALSAAVEAAKGSNVMIGAQNIHWAENGAFTGEISGEMLKETGVTHVIIGHSERRQYFGETDETVNKRTKTALAAGLTPIVCIGETLDERESGKMNDVIKTQVEGGLAGFTAEEMAKIVVAYEPVWAIGTGKTASPEQAQEVHAFVRALLRDIFGAVAEDVKILYGGSMKAANSKELTACEDIDGGLVGGASLKADDFAALVSNTL